MFLSDFSIRRPIVTVVITIGLMAVGWMALNKLRVNERPDVAPPILQVSIPYPGASPETVEREILDRLEKAMRGIPGVHDMRAWADEGSGWFRIEFEFNKNLIEAADEVRNSIASVRYKLPIEMREPIIRRQDPDEWPIMSLSLSSSSQSHIELSLLAEKEIGDRLRGVPGVAVVDISGDLTRELSVLVRSEKLRMHNISVAEVERSLQSQNLTAPGGKLEGDLEDHSIRLLGRLATPEDFSQIVIKRNGDDVLRLGDVAEVVDGTAQRNSIALYNNHASVGINIIRTREASTVAVSKAVRKDLEELRKTLKPGTEIEIANDGGEWAEQSLNNVIESLILGAGLTIFVVYAFLNSWRSTLITALALPTSVLAAFIAVWLFGFSLNFMTLLGLSLAIGVLIDDAIVVRENIVRHMERGEDRVTASREGTKEIGVAVMSTTLSIVAVFVPVAFMGGGPGQWFKPFALTVVASVLVSLFISFSLDPMLSSRWGDPVGYQEQPKRGFSAVLKRFNHWFDQQADRYTLVIRWALGHRRAMGCIAVLSLVAALGLQSWKGGTSFLPAADNGRLVVDIRLPAGASLEYARIKTGQAAELARKLPEVKSIYSDISRDESRLEIDIGKPSLRNRNAAEIGKELRRSINRLVGAEYTVQDDTSNGGDKPIRINFYGQDSRKLMELTNAYMDDLRKIKGAVDVGLAQQDPMPELQIELNRSLASNLGIVVGDAAQALRVAFAGIEVGDWVDPTGETRDVALRLHPEDRTDIAALARLPLVTGSGNSVIPLEQIATIKMDKAPSRIMHTDGKRAVTVTANAEGVAQGEVISAAMKLANAIDFPPGYGIELRGAGREQDELFSAMSTALISGIALMYFILVIQFGSFLAPVPVMMSLPLSLIGVVIALVSTGHTLNLMSFIGIIMLMGLVAKNAILLLDCARTKEKEGLSREEALMQAGRTRLRPILMTTFALIAGMIPVAIGMGEGGEFYQPLAVAIIGGTITSTILTLLMIPTFYDSIEIARERLVKKFHRRAAERGTFTSGVLIALEIILTLTFVRLIYRLILKLLNIRKPEAINYQPQKVDDSELLENKAA
ncbi:MAG: efflux RND transporter permease subunit [Gammaproteobacteria bacterium]|nr:MAG: efflux RND transporter permease subunit [Gammaproteobacteria bacterium]